MEYWKGTMNWPLHKDWKCEVCGENHGLEWGLVHAECRCNKCHTPYMMRARDEKRTILTIPCLYLKEEWIQPVKDGWVVYQRFIEELISEGLIKPLEVPA